MFRIKILVIIFIINYVYPIKLTIKEADAKNKYYISRGALLTLTCESDSISQTETIQWFLPSNPNYPVTYTDSTQPVSVKKETIGNKVNVILTVRDVNTDYSGKYSCQSYLYDGNNQKRLFSADVMVNLFTPITPKRCNSEQWIRINSSATLLCELESEPAALVSWEFNGKTLSQSEKYKIETWGLQIFSVTAADAGQYVVKARQVDYSSSFIKDIIVTTFELPKIISGPTIIRPVTDGVVEDWYSDIQCLATGNPPPTVHWFRKKSGEQELQVINPQKFFINTNPKVGIMRIFRPVYPDDNDEYTCQAMLATSYIDNTNFPKDTVSRKINITVSVRPYFTQIEQMYTVVDPGITAFIRCRVRTTEPVKLVWQKYLGPAYEMGTQKDDPRITVSVHKEPFDELFQVLRLEIANVKFTDSWNYTCIVTSPGSNYTLNGTITVRQKPILSNDTLTEEFGWYYNATNLTCLSYGLPHPTRWFWYRNRFSVLSDINSTFRILSYDFQTHSQSWLQIIPDLNNQFWIFDRYECQAQNEVGEDRRYIRLNRAQVPAPPKVKVIQETSSSIKFQIEPPSRDGGMKLLHYEMIYRALQGPTTNYGPVIYQPDETIISLDGLVHNVNYQVSFYSCNAVGRSIDITVNGKTLSATVPKPVEIVSNEESIYPYSYNLEWKVPLNGGFPLLGYRIFLASVTVSKNYNGNSSRSYLIKHSEFLTVKSPARIYEPALTNPYESVFILDDLDAETIYEISIEAKNMLGFSNKTIFYFYTPVGDILGKPPRIRGFQIRLQSSLSSFHLIIFVVFYCWIFYY